MSIITNLNSDKSKKIELLLEKSLIKYENSKDDMERYRYKLIIDEIYYFERENAIRACSDLSDSLGYIYFSTFYKNFEHSLSFFTKKLIEEILYYKEDAEILAHESYDTFDDFVNDKPKTFLINIISNYDEELGKYTKINTNQVKSFDECISIIKGNWNEFELEKAEFNSLISKLEDYFDRYGRRYGCCWIDIIVFLFKKNDMTDEFKKYYIMEDTTSEEVDELIENNIYGKITNIRDIKIINEMDNIIKEYLNRNGKRLKF